MMKISNLSLFLVICGCLVWTSISTAKLDLDGALGIWLLDDESREIKDYSDAGNDGAITNGNPEWVDGKFGSALEFDQRSWVTMDTPVVTVKNMVDFSMGCWANPGNQQKTWTNILSSHQEPPRRGISFEMLNNDLNVFGIAIGDGPNWAGAGNVQLKTGVWNHLAFVRDGGTGRWFLNGKLQTKNNLASRDPVVPATSRFRIGNWVLGGREFNGIVDESFVFSRALGDDEIESIFKRGFEGAHAVSSKDKAATTWGKIKSWYE